MRQSFIKASKSRQGGVSTRASVAFALLGALGVLACNPSAAALFSDDEARQALNEQSRQLVKLQNEKQALEARVLKLEETLRNQGLLDLLTQIDALNAEISTLRGQSEVHSNNIDAAQKRQKDFYVDLDSRLRRLEQQVAGGGSAAPEPASTRAPDAPDAAAPGGNSPAANSPSGTSGAGEKADSGAVVADGGRSASIGSSTTEPKPPADLPTAPPAPTAGSRSSGKASADSRTSSEASVYDTAYNLFKRGDYAGAVSGFQNFLRLHPNSPLAPNAQYWIGNAQFAQRDFAGTIASQKKLLANYPRSQKAADAMLNIANAQSEMGDAAAAKTTLQDVIGRYPASEAGAKAKRRLSALK